MKDLLLSRNGDLHIDSKTADIQITDSVEQAIRIRLLWFWNEWRFSPEFGIPYFEEILIKNPNKLRIQQIFRDEILSVNEVERVNELNITITPDRRAVITYRAVVHGEQIKGEVALNA